jgi:hypothetical protein
MPELHTPVWQSLPELHILPPAQGRQDKPPQSTSLSVPFLTPSEQLAGAQRNIRQTPLAQSLPVLHTLKSPQGGHVPPPQSTSVSFPSLIPSRQVDGVVQTPALHAPLWQSEPVLQDLPAAHGTQCVPPQSTSVSSWFLTPSEQLAGRQTSETQANELQQVSVWTVVPHKGMFGGHARHVLRHFT